MSAIIMVIIILLIPCAIIAKVLIELKQGKREINKKGLIVLAAIVAIVLIVLAVRRFVPKYRIADRWISEYRQIVFKSDGDFRMYNNSNGAVSGEGEYIISGDKLILSFDNGTTETYTFDIQKNKLLLFDTDGDCTVYEELG